MQNSYSSSLDNESHKFESFKQQPRISKSSLPKQLEIPSDLNPPTINSSFIKGPSQFTEPLRSFLSYREGGLNRFDQARKARTLNVNSEEGAEGKKIEEQEIKKLKKIQFNQGILQLSKQPIYSELNQTEPVSRNIFDKKQVKLFAKFLLQKAYIYRDSYFNDYQKQLLKENYLENNSCQTINYQKNQEQNKPLYFLFWDMIVIIFIIMLCIWLPFKISFDQETNFIFLILAILVMVSDLILNYFKPEISEGNFVSFDIKYKLSFFNCKSLFDICYLFSTTLILLFNPKNSILIWGLLLFQISCGIYKFKILVFRIKDFLPCEISQYKIFMIVIYAIHLFSCIWHFIGVNEEDSWMITLNIQDEDEWTKYCYAIYINTNLLLNIGQGFMHIKTNVELIYSTIITFISCWLVAFIIKHISFMMKENYQIYNQNIQQMKLINNFLFKRGISFQMSARIRNYIRFIQQQDNKEDQVIYLDNQMQILMQQLSPTLKEEILLQMRIKALFNCKQLFKFSKDTLEQLTQIMEYVKFNPNELIIQKNKPDDYSLYIIDSGQILILDQNTNLSELTSGDSFGEFSFFSGQLRQATAKAKGFATLYKIQQSKFVQLVQKNKGDHELYVFIRHSLFNKQFNVVNMVCYSCRSSNHLISQCPIWKYTPDLEKVYKKENYTQQFRSNFQRCSRNDRKEFNRTFSKIIYNKDALKIFRLKYDYIYDEDENEYDDDSENDEPESSSELSDDYQTDDISSDNRLIDKQDGTIVSILKQQDQIKENSKMLQEKQDENDQMFIIRTNHQKGTLNTAQFQHQSDCQQQQQIYKFSLVPQEPQIIRRASIPQDSQLLQQFIQTPTSSQQIANEVPIPSLKRMKNTPHITFKGDTDSQQSQRLRNNSKTRTSSNLIGKMKKNLSKIREEDSDTLNLSNRQQSDEQTSSPFIRQLGRQSQSSSQVRQSMRRFSSKLSTIAMKQGTLTQLRSPISPVIRSNIYFPTGIGMMDLTMYKRKDPQSEEFERMYAYNLYYPIDNYQNVINRLNYFLKWRLSRFIPSKYTFIFKVKQLINKFYKVNLEPIQY